MKLHDDLLNLARDFVSGERRPGQAHLRHAVSASYYALFHLLVDEAIRRMFGREDDRATLRRCLARSFAHSTMANTAKDFAAAQQRQGKLIGARFRWALGDVEIQPEIIGVARKFLVLQSARHAADYDISEPIGPEWAERMVLQAQYAFVEWEKVRGTLQADAFLAGMLLFDKIRVGAAR